MREALAARGMLNGSAERNALEEILGVDTRFHQVQEEFLGLQAVKKNVSFREISELTINLASLSTRIDEILRSAHETNEQWVENLRQSARRR